MWIYHLPLLYFFRTESYLPHRYNKWCIVDSPRGDLHMGIYSIAFVSQNSKFLKRGSAKDFRYFNYFYTFILSSTNLFGARVFTLL